VAGRVRSDVGRPYTLVCHYQHMRLHIALDNNLVASIPVLMMYPFVQKYFVRGVMIGSIKG